MKINTSNISIIPNEIINKDGIYAEIYGKGDPILCIHGNRGAIPVFHGVISELYKYYKLIAVDLPGHRYGPALTEEFILEMQPSIDYCFKAIKLSGEESAHICGHSLGGMIALAMGLQQKEKVRSLIILEGFAKMSERQNECLRFNAYEGSSWEMQYDVYKAFQYGPGVLWHYDFDVTDKLNELNNVLELIGESDEHSSSIFNSWKERFRGNVGSNWTTKMVPHSGHFVTIENPLFIANEIQNFIKKVTD